MRRILVSTVLTGLSCGAIAAPSLAVEPAPVLVKLESRLRVLLERSHPGVRIEMAEAGLGFEHDTRTFRVPEYLKAGEPSRFFEVKGPRPCEAGRPGHGILGSIQVVPGRYAGQRAVAPGVYFQSDPGEHFESLWGLVPSPTETAYLNVTLQYPTCTESAFLKEFREIVQDAWRELE